MPHGLHIDQEDNLWVTDVALHQVNKCYKFNLFYKFILEQLLASVVLLVQWFCSFILWEISLNSFVFGHFLKIRLNFFMLVKNSFKMFFTLRLQNTVKKSKCIEIHSSHPTNCEI